MMQYTTHGQQRNSAELWIYGNEIMHFSTL